MALVKTSNEIVSIRGKIGGVYFKKDNSGQHVQAMPRRCRKANMQWPVIYYGNSLGNRAANIRSFSFTSGLWLLALLGFLAASWAVYALTHYFITKSGEKRHITGYNWYIFYGMQFPEEIRPPFWQPPHSPAELPQHICTYQGMWTYEHAPPEWPMWSPAGYYWFKGPYGNDYYYATDDGNWFLWFKDPKWVLSTTLGIEDPATTFYSDGGNVWDRYYNPVQKKWAKVYLGGGEFPD